MNKLIITNSHLLLIDDSEIKEGDSMLMNDEHPQGRIRKCWEIYKVEDFEEQLMIDDPKDPNRGYGFLHRKECRRILGSIPQIDSLPILDVSSIEEELNKS